MQPVRAQIFLMIGTRLNLAYNVGILWRILKNPYAVVVVWLMRVFATYKKNVITYRITNLNRVFKCNSD